MSSDTAEVDPRPDHVEPRNLLLILAGQKKEKEKKIKECKDKLTKAGNATEAALAECDEISHGSRTPGGAAPVVLVALAGAGAALYNL